jgi:hypothetical protein
MSIISASTAANTALNYQNQALTTNSSNSINFDKVNSISKNDTTPTNSHSSKIIMDHLEQNVGPAFKLDISEEGAYLQSQEAKQQLSQHSLSNSNKSSQSIASLFEA